MRIIRIIFILLLFIQFRFAAFAQDCQVDFLGTKTLYPNPSQNLSPNPAGYAPVFINYVGRHGARHLTKEVKTIYACQLLLKADSANALTPKGQELKQMVLLLEKVEKGNVKSISAEGKTELQGIAVRMAKQNSSVFNQTISLKVSVTKETRTKQSADAFLSGLDKEIKSKPQADEVTDDTNLRFYDASPAYDAFKENGPWLATLQSIQKSEQINTVNKNFAERIFKIPFASKLSQAEMDTFTADIFGFATIVYSLQDEILQAGLKPADLDFKPVFTCDDLGHLGKIDAAEDFLTKGPGTDVNGIQVRIAVPLLINFIKTTDEFMLSGKYNAQLRFAHAETVAPFAALLGISTADRATKDINKINKDWQPAQVAPLSSNIQWVLYQKKGFKDYLVKVMLNEKEIHITGLESKIFPYYRWADLKAFYLKKLSNWNIKPDADMNAYLKKLALN